MATHIDSVRSSALPKVDKAALYAMCQGGDHVLCSGRNAIQAGIEGVCDSPFSHELMLWMPPWATQWLTLESTAEKGVHVGRFSDYVDSYGGDLVLCRRPALTETQIFAQLNLGFALLDDNYDFIEEASMAVRKWSLFSKLPTIKPKDELFCSALMQAISVTTLPYATYGPDWNTPEQNYIDASVDALCAFLGS